MRKGLGQSMKGGNPGSIAWALLGAVWCCGPTQAQELSEREFLTEFPTVLSASRLRQNATETPQAVTVIDQDTIKASGVREIAELFRLVPGFTVSYVTYVKGLQPLVTYHGLGREFFSRLQVLIDGRSMNTATLGGVDWSDIPLALDDIERVEVIRGPNNATNGIGAFLATINFITKHASQERGATLSANVGNGGIRDGFARYGSGAAGFDIRVTGGHRADDGFANLADGRRRDFASVRADWQLTAADSLMLQAGATRGVNDVGVGRPDDPVRKARIETQYAQLKWERNFDADNGLAVQYYFYRFKLSDRFVTGPIPAFNNERFPLDGGSAIRRSDLELQQTFSTGANWRWVWGASAREDLAEAPQVLRETGRLRIERLFGHVEWRVAESVLVNAGAMLEHNNLSGTDVAPQVAVNFRVARDHVVRLGISKALRTPTIFEENVQSVIIVPSPAPPRKRSTGLLRPETIVSRELSYVGDWPAWRATVDLKVFDDRLHDLIDLVGETNTFPASVLPRTVLNGDDARQRGVEGQFLWRPSPETSLVLSAAHVETRSPDRFNSYSTSAPRDTVHALVSRRYAGTWNASAAFHHQSAFRASGFSEPQRGFNRVDVRLAKEFPVSFGRGEVAAVVENLFNEHYTEFRQDSVARRRAWLTLSLRL